MLVRLPVLRSRVNGDSLASEVFRKRATDGTLPQTTSAQDKLARTGAIPRAETATKCSPISIVSERYCRGTQPTCCHRAGED
jgi:hypothetical protein